MKRLLILFVATFMGFMAYAARYEVKYQVRSETSTSHCTAILELKNGTEQEAVEALVRRGTVSKKNAHKVVIVEIKKKN